MKNGVNFYRLSDNSTHTRGFTWAMSIIPRSEMVDRECPECGTVDRYPSAAFDVVLEGGIRYPDALGCGAYPFLIVSQDVIDVWHEAGAMSFHTYPVGISRVKSKKLAGVAPPSYFRVEIDGRCRIDLVGSGLEIVQFCERCAYLVTRPERASGFRMSEGSWDGSALFRDPMLFPRVSFCTEAVLDLACKHRLTNFRFEPMEGPFNPASKGIDYFKRSR